MMLCVTAERASITCVQSCVMRVEKKRDELYTVYPTLIHNRGLSMIENQNKDLQKLSPIHSPYYYDQFI